MVSVTKNLTLIGLLALTIVSSGRSYGGRWGGYGRNVPDEGGQGQGRRSCDTNADCTSGARFVLKLL